jgi:hypothetical protein
MKVISTQTVREIEFENRELILGGTASYSGKPANFMVSYLKIWYPDEEGESIRWQAYAIKLNKNGAASARPKQWEQHWHFSPEARARVEEIAKECDPR